MLFYCALNAQNIKDARKVEVNMCRHNPSIKKASIVPR